MGRGVKIRDFESEATEMQVITIYGKSHVIRPVLRDNKYSDPNYLDTTQALIGILKKHETFEQFKAEWIRKEIKRYKEFKIKKKAMNYFSEFEVKKCIELSRKRPDDSIEFL